VTTDFTPSGGAYQGLGGGGLAPPPKKKNILRENKNYLPNKSRVNFQNPLTILLHKVTILHLNN